MTQVWLTQNLQLPAETLQGLLAGDVDAMITGVGEGHAVPARFGHKQAVIDALKAWNRNFGEQIGWKWRTP